MISVGKSSVCNDVTLSLEQWELCSSHSCHGSGAAVLFCVGTLSIDMKIGERRKLNQFWVGTKPFHGPGVLSARAARSGETGTQFPAAQCTG